MEDLIQILLITGGVFIYSILKARIKQQDEDAEEEIFDTEYDSAEEAYEPYQETPAQPVAQPVFENRPNPMEPAQGMRPEPMRPAPSPYWQASMENYAKQQAADAQRRTDKPHRKQPQPVQHSVTAPPPPTVTHCNKGIRLNSAAEARRAFIYSEIFNRKYS